MTRTGGAADQLGNAGCAIGVLAVVFFRRGALGQQICKSTGSFHGRPEKVEKLNHCESPIVDVEITRFLDGKRDGTMHLDFQATTDPAVAYTGAVSPITLQSCT